MTEPMSPQALAGLLTEHLRAPLPRPREVLLCAPDVASALGEVMPSATPDPLFGLGLALLTGIDIVTAGDFAPGTWRLIRHDACKVDAERQEVRHDGCAVVTEGMCQ